MSGTEIEYLLILSPTIERVKVSREHKNVLSWLIPVTTSTPTTPIATPNPNEHGYLLPESPTSPSFRVGITSCFVTFCNRNLI
jgi:hypothetical protein